MKNAGLDETQARIKIAGININNLRYADNTTLIGEGNDNALQYSCLENPVYQRSWYSQWGCKESDTTSD